MSRHLTSSCSDQETAATALCRVLPTQEILVVKDSDMKAMISQVSVRSNPYFFIDIGTGSSLGARAPQDFATNKDVSCILYVHIFSYLICLGRVALQPKLFFKGPFQVPFLFSENVAWLQGQEQSILPL